MGNSYIIIVCILTLCFGYSIYGLKCYSCYGDLSTCNNASKVTNKTCSSEEHHCIWYVNRGITKQLTVQRDCTTDPNCELARRNDYGRIRCKFCNESLCNKQELIGGSGQLDSLWLLIACSIFLTLLFHKIEYLRM